VRPFSYEHSVEVSEAINSAAAPDAMFLAGGTNLVDLMKLGVARPERLIDVGGLPLDGIEELPDGGLSLGATVRNSDVVADRSVRERYPVLAQALLSGASGQVRNLATVAGNLLQRTRCPYFQDISKPCNKRRPGSGCPAREGEHRNLAIFGHSEQCVATHPSDMAVALAALDARVRLEGPSGTRALATRELHRLPGHHPERDTVLEPGELIIAVELPPPLPQVHSAYRKVRDRASFAFALVAVAALVQLVDGAVSDCRIAFGGVAHGPWRAMAAEESLRGQPANEDSFARAAEAELDQARPLRDNAYKVPLARNLLVRTLEEVTRPWAS
jgi:xanthine dehydrogenase YagS FAD-binding subunit